MNKYRNSFPRIWLTAQHWTCAVFFKLRILTLGGVSHAEFSRNAARNMSLSVAHSETNEGRPALSWNMSAPCRLEAEVWPCQMAVTLGGGCTEVPGFRRNISSGWEENISMVWVSERASECERSYTSADSRPDETGMFRVCSYQYYVRHVGPSGTITLWETRTGSM